ncbi:MAG TPA: DNA-3-methyladenine glycosylase I [Acidobacteriota bacterium]|nr:DNA-3-methyladenine glycosylase I [Acidobacteriota bacterium]
MSATRCQWVRSGGPLDIEYHDLEWGVPVHDDRRLFEFLLLEGAQAGLSWSTILKKREGYRRAFAGFDAARIARFNRRSVERLMRDAGIVRNRLKVTAAIDNARALLRLQAEEDSFARYIWNFVDGAPVQNAWRSLSAIPAQTSTSESMSKDLRQRGFRFVGPTICYAFMQAAGLVNDHTVDCFRYPEVRRMSARR